MTTPQEVLAGVPLFSMLPNEEVAKLARRAHELRVPAGTVVTDMDSVGVSFGVIVDGQATVSVHGTPVRALGPGDFFGEMALLADQPRNATVTTTSEVDALVVSAQSFKSLVERNPLIALKVMRAVADRLPPSAF